jgi:hypothetical protein
MAPYNSPHMLALAQSVAVEVLRDERKIRQSQTLPTLPTLPTLLIVDLSGGDLPDVRYWDTTFGPLWQPTDTYLALGAMHALTTRRARDPLLGQPVRRQGRRRPRRRAAARRCGPWDSWRDGATAVTGNAA